jgi:hypothetical protein
VTRRRLAGHDKADAREHRHRHRRRRQRQGQPDPVGAEHGRGLGPRDVGRALDGTQREYVDETRRSTPRARASCARTQVADTAKPVRVTLAWTDPPPATVTGNAFVNDLDLEVSAGGRTYRGNWLADGFSGPGGQADFRNNVENVVLPASTAGRMSVKVVARTLGGDGVPGNGKPLDQDFALVVSNAQEQASSPVLVQGGVTVDDALNGQNGDGVARAGE